VSSRELTRRAVPAKCPYSVRELPTKDSKMSRTRQVPLVRFVGLSWLELYGVTGGIPLLTGGL